MSGHEDEPNWGILRCQSTFDMLGPNPRPTDLRGTHTCKLGRGHEPPHVCPLCGTNWLGVSAPTGDDAR